MKKYVIHYIFLLNIFFVFVSMHAAVIKPWTFLVYMAAANDLNNYALYDLQEMTKVGSSPYVNIIVYLTIQEEGQPKQTKKLYIEKGHIEQIGPVMMRDSGDISSLAEALQWACLDYPSDHIVVDLWNHGDGILNRSKSPSKGLCHDVDTGHYLTDRDCFHAFAWVKDMIRGGKKFDVIVCDACLCASLEMAYTFSSCADYFVASEETIPKNGFQYMYLLNLLAIQSLDALSLAKLIVNVYDKECSGMSNYTLSATDLNAVVSLVTNVNGVAQILSSQLRGKNGAASKSVIKKCMNSNACSSFDKGIYIDICHFYKNLLKAVTNLKLPKSVSQQFKQLLVTGIELFSKIIKANVMSKNYKQQLGGLSIYFNKHSIDPSYYGLYWTEHNPNWLSFLEAYVG